MYEFKAKYSMINKHSLLGHTLAVPGHNNHRHVEMSPIPPSATMSLAPSSSVAAPGVSPVAFLIKLLGLPVTEHSSVIELLRNYVS